MKISYFCEKKIQSKYLVIHIIYYIGTYTHNCTYDVHNYNKYTKLALSLSAVICALAFNRVPRYCDRRFGDVVYLRMNVIIFEL